MITASLGCLVLGAVLAGPADCPEQPVYTRLGAEDLSDAQVLRLRVDARVEVPVDARVVEAVACRELGRVYQRRLVHVMELRIWGPGQSNDQAPAARALWAPGGEPARARGVSPRDLRQHLLRIEIAGEPPRLVRMPAFAVRLPGAGGTASGPPPRRTPAPRPTPEATSTPRPVVSSVPPTTPRAAPVPLTEADVRVLLERWRRAWESRQLDRYLAFYSSDFRANGKGLAAWRAHKAGVFRSASSISVQVRDLTIDATAGAVTVSFVQVYQSDNHRDVGRKTLRLRDEGGVYRIVRETWSALDGAGRP
jgi:hypothetical protein